jgi:hypothetical protein
MKIAKDRLKQLIKEELSLEGHGEADGSMAQQNLWKICEYAEKLKGIISSDQDLEPWVEEKIAVAAYIMDSVGHYMEFEAESGGEHEEEYEYSDEEDEGGDEEYAAAPPEDAEEDGFEDEEDYEIQIHEEQEEE